MSALAVLTSEDLTEVLAEFLANHLENDDRVQGVIGPIDDTRVLIVLHGGVLLAVDVQRAEVRPY